MASAGVAFRGRASLPVTWRLRKDDGLLFPYRIESDCERVAKRLGDPGRVTGELTALVGARVMEGHHHPAFVEQFTVLEGALSIF